ncbi:unnamed protein product, partial [Rotaria sordida]
MTTTSAHSTAHDDGNANELPMSVVNSNETYDKEHLFRNLSEEKAKFMWFQLLIEIIFRLNCNEYDCRQMLDECRAKYIGNAAELKKMDEFQSSFKPEDAIKWYTRDSFLYRIYQIIHQWELGVRYGLKCLNLQSQCLPEKHPEIADTCLTLGWCYARLGEYKNASEMYHRALDIQMSTLPQYHPQIAATLNNLA